MEKLGRLAEVLGALSLAADLGAGQPRESALGAAIVAVRMGRALGLGEEELAALYYGTVVRFLGCTATSVEAAALGLGDDGSFLYSISMCDMVDPEQMESSLRARLAPAATPAARAQAARQIREGLSELIPVAVSAHCAQALVLARQLPVPARVIDLLAHMYDRWDGGVPGSSGTEIPLGARVINLAVAAELMRRAGGAEAAVEIARARAGGQFDPELSDLVVRDARILFAGLAAPVRWDLYLDHEPGTALVLEPSAVGRVAGVFADYADLKSAYTPGHARQVAALAFLAGEAANLPSAEREQLRLAGLVHDVGRAGVPTGLWDLPRAFTVAERTQVETHSHHTDTVLAMTPGLRAIGVIAGAAHERCDGAGYPRRGRLEELGAGLLAAADMYQALTHDRPWRPALDASAATDLLVAEAGAGRLPRVAVTAVLQAAGQGRNASRAALPAGLSAREVEVLTLLGRGCANKEIASRLGISTKTAEHHVQSVYDKTGARGRAAATLFAVEHGLLHS